MLVVIVADGEEEASLDTGGGLADSYYNETFLMAELLQGYSHALPPRSSSRKPVEVRVQLVLLKILEVSTQLEAFEMQGWMRQYWTDPKLRWDPGKWGISVFSFKPGAIWRPDTRFYEEIDGEFTVQDVIVMPTGEASLVTPFKTRIGCSMDLSAFPMDRQYCDFTLGSWAWSNHHVQVLARPVPAAWWEHPHLECWQCQELHPMA